MYGVASRQEVGGGYHPADMNASHLAVASLLGSLFTPEGLRRFLAQVGEDGPRIIAELSFNAPPAELFAQAAVVLDQFGALDPSFFALLRRERPRRAGDIEAVAAIYAPQDGKVRLTLVIDGVFDSAAVQRMTSILAELRRLSGDDALVVERIRSGSICVDIETTVAGANALIAKYLAKNIGLVAGLPLLAIQTSQIARRARTPTRSRGDVPARAGGGHVMRPSIDTDDRSLLQQWRAGDRIAGESLYNRHHEIVLRFFMRLIYDTSEVKSLVTDTFMTCKTTTADYRGDSGHVRSYILGVARFKLFEYIRRIKRRQRHINPGVDPYDDEITMDSLDVPDPSRFMQESAERKLLLKAMRKIPVDQQVLLILVFWEGMTGPQIADIFDIPRGTAASRLRLARDRLRKQLRTFEEDPALVETTRVTFDNWWTEVKARADSLIAGIDDVA